MRDRLSVIDWIGSVLMVLGSTMFLVGMSWGGNKFGWRSAAVLVAILVGLLLLTLTILYERYLGKKQSHTVGYAAHPVPFLRFEIFQHRSGVIAFVCTMLQGYLVSSVLEDGASEVPRD